MNFSEIFKTINSPLNMENLYNVDKLDIKEFKKTINPNIPQKKDLYKISAYLNVPINTLYLTTNIFSPLVYLDLNNLYYMEIPTFNINFYKTICLDKNIIKIKKKTNELLKNKNYTLFFSVIDKKISLLFFEQIINKIPKQEAYDIFLSLYSRNDYALNVLKFDFIKNILKYNKNKIIIPNISENKKVLTIYRGQTNDSTPIDKALSWTLNKNIANFFATRFQSKTNNNSKIYTANINIKDIKAYIECEEEIIAYPKDITIIKEEKI